jgi:hypothetical protein
MDRIYLARERRETWRGFFEHGKGNSGFIKCGTILLAEELFGSPSWPVTLL